MTVLKPPDEMAAIQRMNDMRCVGLDAALEAIPANSAVLDAAGMILLTNGAWNAFANENGGHADLGVNYFSVCDSAEGDDGEQAKAFAAGIRSVINGERGMFSMDYPCHSPKLTRWFTGYVTPLTTGGGERCILVMHFDISAQKETQEVARHAEQRHSTLYNTMMHGVVHQDACGKIISANPAAQRILGMTLPELQGTTSEDFERYTLREDGSPFPGLKHPTMEALRTGREVADVVMGVYNPAENRHRWITVSAVPLFQAGNDEEPCGAYSVFEDITEIKKKEMELHRLNRTLKALRGSSQAMNHATQEASYMDDICRIVVQDCGHAMVWIGFAEEDKEKSIRPVAHAGFEDGYVRGLKLTWADCEFGRGPAGIAIRTGKPSVCRNIQTDPSFVPWREQAIKRGYSSSLALPLMTNGRSFGIISFYSREPDAFSEDEVKLLTQLADDLAYGIATIRLRLAIERSQEEREITIEFLRMVNASTEVGGLVRAAATFFQQKSGCQAVGVRLKEGEDYPYYEARGFTKEFILAENRLCARDRAGNIIRDESGYPICECMCGNVICGRFDPAKPFFTEHGVFWTNCTTDLLATTTEADRQVRTRNRCNGEGYESVALIPLRIGAQRLGLLQLNDRRKGRFSPEAIGMWERLADYLAVALAKFQAEDTLRESERRYSALFANKINGMAHCRIITDEHGKPVDCRILEVNEAYERIIGIKKADIEGRIATEVFSGIKRYAFDYIGMFGKIACEGGEIQFEAFFEATRQYLSIYAYSPTPGEFTSIFTDVTQRKERERQLRQARIQQERLVDELQAVMDAVPAAILVARDAECREMSGSKFAQAYFALPPGANFSKSAPPDERPTHYRAMKDGREIPLGELPVQMAASGRAVSDFEYNLVFEDGKVSTLFGNAVPLLDETGQSRGAIGAFIDISERKRVEQALQDAQARLKAHADDLEKIVAERTAALQEQTAKREQLQKELLKISEREKQLISQELHDGLCQNLAGTAFMARTLHSRMVAQKGPDVKMAGQICDLLNTSVNEARNLSHGLHPVAPIGEGLMNALSQLAGTVRNLFHIHCTFRCPEPVFLENETISTHLFRITQEAINNARKHGEADRVTITLSDTRKGLILTIRDNGIGIPAKMPKKSGMGLAIMERRASEMGASLSVRRAGRSGTVVTCTLPADL